MTEDDSAHLVEPPSFLEQQTARRVRLYPHSPRNDRLSEAQLLDQSYQEMLASEEAQPSWVLERLDTFPVHSP